MTELLTSPPQNHSEKLSTDIVTQTVGALVIRLLSETHAKGNSVEIPSLDITIPPKLKTTDQ